jgi:excisionase family DNA binding protein
MANYLSLEEAAEKLGIPTERLVDLRSQGEVRGFRDGASWKFPEDEIERLADELSDGFGGDFNVELGNESMQPADGSDVNLVAAEGEGSDVAIVTNESGGSGLLEFDSGDLELDDPASSGQLNLAIEPNSGSTGPVTDAELKEISESHPDVLSAEADKGSDGGGSSGSMLNLGGELDDIKINTESDLSFPGLEPDDDSGEELLGADDDSIDVLGSDIGQPGGSQLSAAGASNLEMMDDLNDPGLSDVAPTDPRGADVLSELDLLSAEQQDSGLITGDSALASSGLGSSVGALNDSDLGGLDDALDDDDDLVIADDDDDLVISNAGSDISVAGDSGINLMSPSDSGLSLESEPLDLAGSSISALDLGAELSEGGSSGSGGSGEGSGSMVDFQADEEFQLSPSGVGLDADIESDSQVIEVEDSEAIAEPIEFGDVAVADDPLGGDVFGEPEAASDAFAMDEEGEAIAIDESTSATVAPAGIGGGGYEVPFSLPQCITLMLILFVLSLGGMLMTDLVRNMWTYSEPTAPVSSLTDSLIAWMGWGQ